MSSFSNTRTRYGSVTKAFHWLTALLILTILPLGIIGQNIAEAIKSAESAPDQAMITRAAFIFSLHKTLGLAVFFTAVLRIFWALSQPRPALLNGDKPAEAFAATTVHWLLYGSLVLVPLSGWVHHAATSGFAPIWWPFGQTLPFVPVDPVWEQVSHMVHYLMQWVLVGALGLHIAGALKHHFIDGDATLRRMLPGHTQGMGTTRQPGHIAPLFAALAVWGMVMGGAAAAGLFTPKAVVAPVTTLSAEGGNWQVQDGTLQISVVQMGADISGEFADWSAQIQYSETPDAAGKHGEVVVEIATATLTLGSVTNQATGPAYLASADHPVARFAADILSDDGGLEAVGTLEIRGVTVDAALPFELSIEGETATATGAMKVDRRDFSMGLDVTDEGSLAFGVEIAFELTATRATAD